MRTASIITTLAVSIVVLYLAIMQIVSVGEPYIHVTTADRAIAFGCSALFVFVLFVAIVRDRATSTLTMSEWGRSILRRTLIGTAWAVVALGACFLYLVIICAKYGSCL